MSVPTCPRCGGAFEKGFMLLPRHYLPFEWVEGDPGNYWTGMLPLMGRRKIPTRALRCSACGYLEFYARGDRKKKKE